MMDPLTEIFYYAGNEYLISGFDKNVAIDIFMNYELSTLKSIKHIDGLNMFGDKISSELRSCLEYAILKKSVAEILDNNGRNK